MALNEMTKASAASGVSVNGGGGIIGIGSWRIGGGSGRKLSAAGGIGHSCAGMAAKMACSERRL